MDIFWWTVEKKIDANSIEFQFKQSEHVKTISSSVGQMITYIQTLRANFDLMERTNYSFCSETESIEHILYEC